MENEKLLSWKPELKDCPNVPIWQKKCLKILQGYNKLIQWSLATVPEQGSYLLPIQDFLNENMSEVKHANSLYTCSYAGGYISEPKAHNEIISTIRDENSKPKISNDKPFIIGICEMEVKSDELSLVDTSSLSSFDYDGHKYASLKVCPFFLTIFNYSAHKLLISCSTMNKFKKKCAMMRKMQIGQNRYVNVLKNK